MSLCYYLSTLQLTTIKGLGSVLYAPLTAHMDVASTIENTLPPNASPGMAYLAAIEADDHTTIINDPNAVQLPVKASVTDPLTASDQTALSQACAKVGLTVNSSKALTLADAVATVQAAIVSTRSVGVGPT